MKNPESEKKLIHFIKSNNSNHSLYWYPLVDIEKSLCAAAYDIARIYQDNQIFLLENVVKTCNIAYVNMFQMDHREYFESQNILRLLHERDEDGYTFQWYAETFLFDQSEEWLIYLSHEHTITFTGDKIVTVAKRIIPAHYLIAKT